MKIALVGPELEENLALRYLHASVTRAGYEARIVEFDDADQIESVAMLLAGYKPELIGLSMVFTGRAREYVALAKKLRQAGVEGHITAGGHFASFHADRILEDYSCIDSVVHGEGEETLADLASHLPDLSAVSGISYRGQGGHVLSTGPRDNPADLDSRPFPTRTPPLHTYLGIPIANILGSRGCFASCSFCSIAAWYRKNGGKRFRQRRAECVAEEMAALYHDHGVRIFNFHDDNFFLPGKQENIARFRSLSRALDKAGVENIAIQVKARPDSMEKDVIQALAELGLFRVFLGVESNAAAGLETLGRGIKREQNHKALGLLRDMGIQTSFNLLMFDPETTPSDLEDNIAFLRQYPDFPLNFGRVEVYSGTPLEHRLRAEGRLQGNYFGYTYRMRDERVEQAFQIFKKVFTPRNFEQDGLNLQAMKLDYYWHLLRRFHPGRAGKGMSRDVRAAISALNRNSAGLLGRICDFASAEAFPADGRTGDFADCLRAEREAYDKNAGLQMKDMIARFERAAQACPGPRARYGRMAAAAAAALVLVTASGCKKDWHPCEMMMWPMEPTMEPDNA